jgi:hypothetical protein
MYTTHTYRCCGSGIRDSVFFFPGAGMGTKIKIRIRDHISESLETNFWVKYLHSLMRMRTQKLFDPGSGIEKIRIRNIDTYLHIRKGE